MQPTSAFVDGLPVLYLSSLVPVRGFAPIRSLQRMQRSLSTNPAQFPRRRI